MFCPNCGASEQQPDAYCKKCGTYLRDDSFRGRLLGANNPEKAAWLILFSSVFIAALCLCISLLIIRAGRSGDLASLKYAAALCWLIIGYLVTLSVVGFRLRGKMRRARSSLDERASVVNNYRGVGQSAGKVTGRLTEVGSSGEAATELLSPPPRENEERKQAR
jgi:hypothetical protein